ncbi:MAG: hypothetical protein MI923_14640 [Phycisphaerales bacterium]|nr:hypothetical protein [Phycisphaerales bacterium]
MPSILSVVVVLFVLSHSVFASRPAFDDPKPIGADDGIFIYQFEKGALHYQDVLTQSNGRKLTGKIQQWANQILVFDAGGHAKALALSDVKEIDIRRSARHTTNPGLPDLTVAYVERLPRDPSWRGHVVTQNGLGRLDIDPNQIPWQPSAGSKVTFRVHVLNAGAARSAAVPCRVLIDDQEIHRQNLTALAPGAEQVFEASWNWEKGQHSIRVDIDPEDKAPEVVRWNNSFVEPIRSLGVAVVVARERYEAFRRSPNVVDSFCFEDYIQYHIRNMNALFKASVYPSAPDGIVERVRCDRIIVVDDPFDANERKQWEPTLRRGGEADGLLEHAALLLLGGLSEEEDLRYDALKVDWRLLQQIGRQLGLIDLTKTDTTLEQCYVLDKHGRYALRRHVSPSFRTLMYEAGGYPFTESGACYLNKTLGRPRGFEGDYLYQLPDKVVLEVLSNAGGALPGIQVDVFQLKSEGPDAGKVMGVSRQDPLLSTVTNDQGRAELVNFPAPSHKTPGGYELRPNPFGKISTDGSNGLLLLRLRSAGSEEFHFLPLSTCNVACLRGSRQAYVHRLETRIGAPDSPPRPPDSTTRMLDRTTEKPPLLVTWWFPQNADPDVFKQFRIYKRTGFAGDDTKPWALSTIKEPSGGKWTRLSEETYFDPLEEGPYSLDTFFAVSSVDEEGRESGLSEPTCLPYDVECVQFAIEGQAAYMTLRGGGAMRMLYWDAVAGTQPYGVKTGRFEGYSPSFSGIAFTPDRRMVLTDPVNHVLAFCDVDRQELVELVPRREYWPSFPSMMPGEFSYPADVAADDSGNLYVADQGNHRIQILDSEGRYKGILDEDFRFKGPDAVGYANGHLCVTDNGRRRCRVYKVDGGQPSFVRELLPLFDAGRGLVNKSGEVFITGRSSETGTWAVQVFAPMGKTAKLSRTLTEGQLGRYHRPRGLYFYLGGGSDFAYFVNDFPFDVRRISLAEE